MKNAGLILILIIVLAIAYYGGSYLINYLKPDALFKSSIKPIINDPRRIAKKYERVDLNDFRMPDNGRNGFMYEIQAFN